VALPRGTGLLKLAARATGLLVAVLAGAVVAAGACGGSGRAGAAGASGKAGGGTTGAAGSAGTGGGVIGEPPCPSRAVLGNLCTVADPPLCYTRCGPEGAGDRAATCDPSGVYIDAAECIFNPAFDWSPYKIPSAGNAACGAGVTPHAFAACDVETGIVCNSQAGVTGGTYVDTGGVARVGYCVCVVITTIGDTKGWSCAPDADWPCPRGRGC
jgi:hypothetical protein